MNADSIRMNGNNYIFSYSKKNQDSLDELVAKQEEGGIIITIICLR